MSILHICQRAVVRQCGKINSLTGLQHGNGAEVSAPAGYRPADCAAGRLDGCFADWPFATLSDRLHPYSPYHLRPLQPICFLRPSLSTTERKRAMPQRTGLIPQPQLSELFFEYSFLRPKLIHVNHVSDYAHLAPKSINAPYKWLFRQACL